jgi:GNAT superfamily N-acetyltransferase
MIAAATKISFARAPSLQAMWAEIFPLFEKHWLEIAHFDDIPLNPDTEQYFKIDALGLLHVYTARDEAAKLVGYAVYFVAPHLHFKQSLQATQDVLFIDKESRGFGMRFIRWCDEQLRVAGVQVVANAVAEANDYALVLRRMGYKRSDQMYVRRLA